jgi:hypothetical protein
MGSRLVTTVEELANGTLKAEIASIPEKLLEGAEQAVLETAQLVLGLAQVHVRVDTGSLRDSGRLERGGQGMHWRGVKVRFGGYVTNPRTGKLVDYAGHVERKYPFLAPAIREAWPEILATVNRIARHNLEGSRYIEVL